MDRRGDVQEGDGCAVLLQPQQHRSRLCVLRRLSGLVLEHDNKEVDHVDRSPVPNLAGLLQRVTCHVGQLREGHEQDGGGLEEPAPERKVQRRGGGNFPELPRR
eukprot:842588-Rhodomonas_salina.2